MPFNPDGQESFRLREVLTTIHNRAPKFYYIPSTSSTSQSTLPITFLPHLVLITKTLTTITQLIQPALDPSNDYAPEFTSTLTILHNTLHGIDHITSEDHWYDELTYILELFESVLLLPEAWLFDEELAIAFNRRTTPGEKSTTLTNLTIIKTQLLIIFSTLNNLLALLPEETPSDRAAIEVYRSQINWAYLRQYNRKHNWAKAVYRAHSLYPADKPVGEPRVMVRVCGEKIGYTVFCLVTKMAEVAYRVRDPEGYQRWEKRVEKSEEEDSKRRRRTWRRICRAVLEM